MIDRPKRTPTVGLTKAQHDALVKLRGRPVTDRAIGTHSTPKRQTDALCSEIVGLDHNPRHEQLERAVKTRKPRRTPA